MGMPTAIKCTLCAQAANPINVYFETIAGYNNHIKEAHNSTNYIGTACKCYVCNTYHDTCNALTNHLSTHNIR